MTTTVAGKPITPGLDARARFITRVYGHVLAAILALVALEVALFKSGVADRLNDAMRGVPWILILGGFMIVGWLARRSPAMWSPKGSSSCPFSGAPTSSRPAPSKARHR